MIVTEVVSTRSTSRLLKRIVTRKNVFKVHGGPSPNFKVDKMATAFKEPQSASVWKTPRYRLERVMHNIEYSRLMRKMKGKGFTDNQIRGIERMRDTSRVRPTKRR